jgi:hypothetical protein
MCSLYHVLIVSLYACHVDPPVCYAICIGYYIYTYYNLLVFYPLVSIVVILLKLKILNIIYECAPVYKTEINGRRNSLGRARHVSCINYYNMQNYSEKYKNHLENLNVQRRIIAKLILTKKKKKKDRPAVVWTEFSWLWIRPSIGPLWTQQWNIRFQRRCEIFDTVIDYQLWSRPILQWVRFKLF